LTSEKRETEKHKNKPQTPAKTNINPGFAASYDIRPQTRSGSILEQTHMLTYLLTYLRVT